MRRTVADVMTRDVVSVREATPFKEIVWRMRSRDVSAVPVLDPYDRLVVGVVSEADLLLKEEGLDREAPPSSTLPTTSSAARRETSSRSGPRKRPITPSPTCSPWQPWTVS